MHTLTCALVVIALTIASAAIVAPHGGIRQGAETTGVKGRARATTAERNRDFVRFFAFQTNGGIGQLPCDMVFRVERHGGQTQGIDRQTKGIGNREGQTNAQETVIGQGTQGKRHNGRAIGCQMELALARGIRVAEGITRVRVIAFRGVVAARGHDQGRGRIGQVIGIQVQGHVTTAVTKVRDNHQEELIGARGLGKEDADARNGTQVHGWIRSRGIVHVQGRQIRAIQNVQGRDMEVGGIDNRGTVRRSA